MTDRELLELAAKAAGIEQGAERADCGISTTLADGRHRHLPRWNPLTGDGDALRLAAKLSLHIEWRLDGRVAVSPQDQVAEIYIMESSREDRIGSLRRAIVRAAAEIGRAALAQEQGGSDANGNR